MRDPAAATGSAVFFMAAPGVVDGLIPWWLTGWQVGRLEPPLACVLVRFAGAALLLGGLFVLVQSFVRFVTEGAGTPAPIAPTKRLVIGGLYRYVRNPMYLAVVAIIVGQALLLDRPILLLYAGCAGALMLIFVRGYEEPALQRTYGADYETYRQAVPGWWPCRRPWQPGDRLADPP